MDTKAVGTRHGAAVRRVVGFAADIVVALGKDVVLNARRGGGYLGGFATGLVRGRDTVPNA
jgi:hypothetical protein